MSSILQKIDQENSKIEDSGEPTPNPQRPCRRDLIKEIWPRPKLDNRPGLEGGRALEFHTAPFHRDPQASPDAGPCARLLAFGFMTRHAPAVY
jgi:hypothetical protein